MATLSPKNFKNCLNLAICFSENRSFSPDFGGSCRLLAIFRPKKFTGCNCTLWTLEQSFNLIFSKFKKNRGCLFFLINFGFNISAIFFQFSFSYSSQKYTFYVFLFEFWEFWFLAKW
jgi:hypothetical protein